MIGTILCCAFDEHLGICLPTDEIGIETPKPKYRRQSEIDDQTFLEYIKKLAANNLLLAFI